MLFRSLTAATNAVALAGVAASTTRIARDAGVAEGTLFVYFPTKDDLLNQLYLDLKSDLEEFLAIGYPVDATVEEQVRHIWNSLIDWGASKPGKLSALQQLGVSEKITEASRNAGAAMFTYCQAMMDDGFKEGILRQEVNPILGEIIQALADMVMQLSARDPGKLEHYKYLGWEALWGAIAHR